MLRRRGRPGVDRVWTVVPGRSLGPVHIGMTEREIRRVLHRPESQRERKRWWAKSSLCVELDEQERVAFVEVSHDAELGWRALYDQRDLLTVPADDAPAILHRERPRYEEDGYSLMCPTGLALWRPFKPETDDDDAIEPEDDHQTGRCWSTVAVAAVGYWPIDSS